MVKTLSRETEKNKQEYKYSDSQININKLHNIETKLFEIFNSELNRPNSAIISYKPQTIRKMAQFISGNIKRSAAIGIAGETASGKSTIAYDIIETLEIFSKLLNITSLITRVNTDDYYYDRSEEVKKAGSMAEFAKNYDFDVPEALELDLMYSHIKKLLAGESVMLPKYDMSGTTIRYDNHTLAKPSQVIISEGLFTLTDKIKDAFDFKIYVDIDANLQKERFFIRANERGLGDSANSIYKNASNKAEIYIRPAREEADIVLSGAADRKDYKLFISKIILLAKETYFANRIAKK